MNRTISVNCPSCKTEVAWNEQSPFRPFCSKRCQLHDFGDWAREEFRIPSNPNTEDQLHEEDEF